MKVMFFEVTQPVRYEGVGKVIGGWQDSLETIVRSSGEIELSVAFFTENNQGVKEIGGVTYYPMSLNYSLWKKLFASQWDVYVEQLIPQALQIVNQVHPDVIHVFGTEWPLAQIAQYTEIPVVVHIQGAILPYNNAGMPPGYSRCEQVLRNVWNPHELSIIWRSMRDNRNRAEWERKTWKLVTNYMGRTIWDEAVSSIEHPNRRYFHVEEALRPEFCFGEKQWQMLADNKLRLVTTGISSFWKGPDMLLKTARTLKEYGIDFEWKVAGSISPKLKRWVEKHENTTFEANNVTILGFIKPDALSDLLCHSTMMVHTAYIENSPNSICEAQCLGVPVVSTNVGGISTLLRDGVDGVLVPANDPWQMAYVIISLAKDKERLHQMSESTRQFALARHNPESILNQLMKCYRELIQRED